MPAQLRRRQVGGPCRGNISRKISMLIKVSTRKEKSRSSLSAQRASTGNQEFRSFRVSAGERLDEHSRVCPEARRRWHCHHSRFPVSGKLGRNRSRVTGTRLDKGRQVSNTGRGTNSASLFFRRMWQSSVPERTTECAVDLRIDLCSKTPEPFPFKPDQEARHHRESEIRSRHHAKRSGSV